LPSDNLVGRAAESKVICDFLSKHISEETAASLYVSGAPGTGKTAVLSKAIEHLKVGVFIIDSTKMITILRTWKFIYLSLSKFQNIMSLLAH